VKVAVAVVVAADVVASAAFVTAIVPVVTVGGRYVGLLRIAAE
jgi:hypothetical protein